MARITLNLSDAEMAAVLQVAKESLISSPEEFLWNALNWHMRGHDGRDHAELFQDLQEIRDRFENGELPEWATDREASEAA